MQAEIGSARPAAARVDVAGDIDEKAAPAVAVVASARRAPARRLVLELSEVTSCDAAGVAALEEARAVAEAAGRVFILANPSLAALEAMSEAGGGLLPFVTHRAVLRAVPDSAAAPDVEARVVGNRALADALAARFAGRGQPLDDLRQVAYLGLIMAAKRFDPDRAVRFTTYAQATIVGELKRHFRDHAWQLHVARPLQEMYLAVRASTDRLTHELGRAPTPAEIAADVGATEEQVIESLEARSALRVESLDVPRDADDERPWHEQAVVEDGFAAVEERSWLVPALRRLPERERRILKLRFFDGLAQSAIAAEVGVSQMHVSRLLARSLQTLRAAASE